MSNLIKKVLVFLKWFFILLLIGFILFLIIIYISSLSSYKKSDFNIPENFFQTKFGDKNPYSKKNGFNDLVKFTEILNKNKDIEYVDILSKCKFDSKVTKEKCEEYKKGYFKKIIKSHDKELDKQISDLKKEFYKNKYGRFKLKELDKIYYIVLNEKKDLNKIDFKTYILDKLDKNREGIKRNYIINNIDVDKYIKYRDLINQKYIKLDEEKVYLLKNFYSYFSIKSIDNKFKENKAKLDNLKPSSPDFYKVYNYIENKKVYGKLKKYLDGVNKVNPEIKTIADIGKIIDKINNGVEVDNKDKSLIENFIKNLYGDKLNFNDFKIYQDSLIGFEKNKYKILESKIKNFKHFVQISIILNYKKINNKEYILQTPEYFSRNNYNWGKTITYTGLLRYSRSIRYIVYKYLEEGNYNKGIKIFLEHQKFIDNLINKTDSTIINNLDNILIEKINLEFIEYILDNYKLSKELKDKIKIVLEKKLDKGLIDNALKREHLVHRTIYKFLWDKVFTKEDNESYFSYYKGILSTYLFYSVHETELISDKIMYDYLTQKDKSKLPKIYNKICGVNKNIKFSFKNLNNYIGRLLICSSFINYSFLYKKEQNLRDLRNKILEKLN